MPPLMFAASVTVTKAREAKTWADSPFFGTKRTAVSFRFHMRSCEIPKRAHRWMTHSCKSFRSLAMSASLASRRELPQELQAPKKLPRPFLFGLEFDAELAQHTAVDMLPSGDAEAKPGYNGMSEVRKTRKGEW